jgi:general stress protein CsbA
MPRIKYLRWEVLALTAILVFAQTSIGQDSPAIMRDLTAVIQLDGKPCGQVVRFQRVRENEYIVFCQDGNRYRVLKDAEGRVTVEKR